MNYNSFKDFKEAMINRHGSWSEFRRVHPQKIKNTERYKKNMGRAKKYSAEMLREMTPSEKDFEKVLKYAIGNRDIRIIKQKIITVSADKFFILDFHTHPIDVCFEIDGDSHNNKEDYDTKRDIILMEKGIMVVRIKNENVNKHETLLMVKAAIDSRYEK